VFTSYRKKVALVGGSGGSVGFDPKKAIGHLTRRMGHKYRCSYGTLKFRGERLQKIYRLRTLGSDLASLRRGESG